MIYHDLNDFRAKILMVVHPFTPYLLMMTDINKIFEKLVFLIFPWTLLALASWRKDSIT